MGQKVWETMAGLYAELSAFLLQEHQLALHILCTFILSSWHGSENQTNKPKSPLNLITSKSRNCIHDQRESSIGRGPWEHPEDLSSIP